ncbi:tetratricopeptide repeat protein [Marinomonas sp. 15G1-11]|uniref:Ancillary SecYEG translocon subunit n=1 Tax=Marinomonas phaeophyticola TaxID=3004091 RepID=A0ABT4JXK8_9GAMM|nr:tetratricopeptide repeat protein [Marinomonas sp. 15G1-11]MCZ2723130.1 tetratricopeptide repeat protein [Marinomonas sp. 15G1-11]
MSELKTEEEQIEAFKEWWKKNGTSLVLAVSIGVAGYFGSQAWFQSQENHISEASALYQNMMEAAADLSAESNQKTVTFIANQLSDDYSDTGYAAFGQLYVARIEAEKGEFDNAISSLKQAQEKTEDVSLNAIANLRIARLLLEKQDYDAALTQVEKVTYEEFTVQKQELKGDILLASGKKEEARVAYEAANNALESGSSHPLLNIKLQDLVKS